MGKWVGSIYIYTRSDVIAIISGEHGYQSEDYFSYEMVCKKLYRSPSIDISLMDDKTIDRITFYMNGGKL